MGQAGVSRTCANCGTANSIHDQFCSNCGYSLASGPPDKTALKPPIAPTVATANRRITGALLAGNLLGGRYRVVQMIGKGGFGAVYKASDERFQSRRVVAMKEMSDSRLSPQEKATAIQSFRNEAGLLVELNHPNLPNVSDFFEEGGKAYLVMEFVEGKTLETVQEEAGGPLNEAMVMGWALQLCTVLHYLHTRPQPIIFRDMKPANVMVTADGQIKLIDFGIARIFKAAVTKDTTLLGSQGYAPLEQYGRGQSDARSDIYALGATLYDLLTKELPADSPTRRIHPQTFMPPRQINPAITPATEAIVVKAMADEPPDRYQSAADMYQAIAATGIAHSSNTLQASSGNTLTQLSSSSPQSNTPTGLATGSPSGPNTAPPQYSISPANPSPPVPPPLTAPPAPLPPGQSHISRRRVVIAGATIVGAAVVGSSALYFFKASSSQTGSSSQTSTGTLTINFTYSTEKQDWMQQAIQDFNKSNTIVGSKQVQVTGSSQGSGDSKNAILNGTLKPVAWSPASTLEINQLNAGWNTKYGQDLTISSGDFFAKQLVLSPLVFAVWSERAALLLKQYGKIDWESIHSAVQEPSWSNLGGSSSWGPVKLGQTSPEQSNSGLLSIALLAYAYYNISRGLTVAQIQSPAFLKYFQDIEGVVQAFGRSSGTYLKNEVILKGPAGYDIIPIYENLILTNEQDAKQRNNQTLRPYYPGVNILSDHPFAILNGKWVSPAEQEAAKAFRDFLLSDAQQSKALLSGFRPTSQNITIHDSIKGNPFKGQPSDIIIPPVISNQAQAPNGNVVNELLTQWHTLYSGAPTAISNDPNKGKGSGNVSA